jgi:hypothetical protein
MRRFDAVGRWKPGFDALLQRATPWAAICPTDEQKLAPSRCLPGGATAAAPKAGLSLLTKYLHVRVGLPGARRQLWPDPRAFPGGARTAAKRRG